jgi:hypothetical protein
LWPFLYPMLSRTSRISSASIRERPANRTVIRTLSQHLLREGATPNHALQRTAPRVTVAAISRPGASRPGVALSHVRCLLLRSTPQLPRRAPQSLSLGSLGVLAPLP